MAKQRDPSDIVPFQLRIREDLRQDLERSAKARRVSLNQEAIDRLAYARDRKGLLVEIMRFAFSDERLVGLLIAMGIAMGAVVRRHPVDSAHRQQEPTAADWIDDPTTYNQVMEAAMAILESARPAGKAWTSNTGCFRADQTKNELIGRWPPGLKSGLPPREIETVREILGPLAQRMASPPDSRVSIYTRRLPTPQEGEQPLTNSEGTSSRPTSRVKDSEPIFELHRDSATGEIRTGGQPSPMPRAPRSKAKSNK